MKKIITIIIAAAASAQAGDRRLAEALEQAEFKLRELEYQIEKVERQSDPIEKDDGLTSFERHQEQLESGDRLFKALVESDRRRHQGK